MKTNKLLLAFTLLLSSFLFEASFAQVTNFPTAGTFSYTVPPSTTKLKVQIWGAGGHGSTQSLSGQGGGAGGGAYTQNIISVTPGEVYTIVVGAGSNSTSPGGTSSFNGGSSSLQALGGNSAANNSQIGASGASASAPPAICNSCINFSGGNGADASATESGAGGSSASANSDGVNAVGIVGGVIAGGGNGGNGTSNSGLGATGAAPGGGGAGAVRTAGSTKNGGIGGRGKITLTATGPIIDVKGKFNAITYNSTTFSQDNHTDLGSVSIEGGTVSVIYTIKNIGNEPLNIGAIGKLGIHQTDYTLTSLPAPTLAPNASTTFSVQFDPSGLGDRLAKISIANTDPSKSNFTFDIKGLGVRTYIDSDGDGVSDNFDIDDDNDGILDITEQILCKISPYAQSVEHIFLNETFGAGTTKGKININIPDATCTYCFEDGTAGVNSTECPRLASKVLDDGEYCVNYKITGATGSDPENIHGDLAWYAGEDHTPGDINGRMAIFNADYVPGVFYETTIRGVIPNVPVLYSFWALNIMAKDRYVGTILPNITVEFRDLSNNLISTYNTGDIGRCLASATNNDCAQSEWKQFTTSVTLGAISDFVVRFKNNAPGGGGNDLALDDIVISQEYCDSDHDGIPNLYDLDSDNDGISDIEEAGFKDYSNGTATMYKLSSSTWIDENKNGLHDELDSRIAAGTYSILDTDADGVKNFMDLDSDNDSLFDVDEAGIYNGDGDINGDGLGDGVDTERDGILDIYDTFIGFGTATRPYAQDTDGNGVPDYMQLDSDSNGVMDIAETIYNILDANNDGRIDGFADVDKDGIIDTFDTKTNGLGSPRDLNRKFYLDFDGRNDYGLGDQITSGLGQATMMGWIKLYGPYLNSGVVMGQGNFNLSVDVTGSNRSLVGTANGINIISTSKLDSDRWYHIAMAFNPSDPAKKLKLYVNGKEESFSNAGALGSPLAAVSDKFTLAKNPSSATNYFKGSIDEVRVFNVALSDDQLQKMVYQEIKSNEAAIRGEVIPKDIELVNWNTLLAYYRMDAYKDDVIDNFVSPAIDSGTDPSLMRIYNVKNIRYQLAPMPFESKLAGNLDVAVSQNNFVYGPDLRTYDWAILKSNYNTELSANLTTLGLFIAPGTTFKQTDDSKNQNSWYLKLDGKLDLLAKSQLVQTEFSDLDPTSTGFIERDQQGQKSKFNYNYWSSPVNSINPTANNTSFNVLTVMKDGTDANNPVNMNFVGGTNGSPGTPINVANYWLFKYTNSTPSYSNWQALGSTGTLVPGQGYTMKGSDSGSPLQNYVFVGKPNNGTITTVIGAGNTNLVGNPYASALDANEFISQNLSSISGTLYFWEHYSTNSSHVLAAYQGGYATRTLVGGVAPVSPALVSGLGSSTRIPNRFIPVGQGFFIKGNATGGNVNFSNKQRLFIKENNVDSNVMFRNADGLNTEQPTNAEDTFEEDTFMKVRLAANSHDGHHRQLLLGFMNENATPEIDLGYDAIHIDNQPTDIFFLHGDTKLVIQGDGYFNDQNIYPLGVKTDAEGKVQFLLDGTENFPIDQPIYIHDALDNSYNDIRTDIYEAAIDQPGTISDRFSLTFTNSPLSTNTPTSQNQGMSIQFSNSDNMINVQNLRLDADVISVSLINMLGQILMDQKVDSQNQNLIKLKAPMLSTGTYIIKAHTTKGDFSKKAIIK